MGTNVGRCRLMWVAWVCAGWVQAAPIGFTDAQQQGSFNIGPAQVSIFREFQSAPINRNLLIVDYSIPDQSVAGVWAKKYPSALAKNSADVIELGLDTERKSIR